MKFKTKLSGLVKKKSPKEYILYSLFYAVCILLDQLTKLLAVKLLSPNHPYDAVPIIKGVLQFNYETNPGCAWGMLQDAPWVFNSFSTVAIIAITAYLYLGHAANKPTAAALIMIAAGGIGNMIDRIANKYVVDFIDFCLINFPVFNVADSFVCIGAGLLILIMVLEIIAEAKEKGEKNASDS